MTNSKRLFVFLLLGLSGIASGFAVAADFADLAPKPPRLRAESYILIEASSGRTLAEFNADERNDPASLTKIMTVYVAANALKKGAVDLEQKTTVSEKAWKMEGSRMFIEFRSVLSQTNNRSTIMSAVW